MRIVALTMALCVLGVTGCKPDLRVDLEVYGSYAVGEDLRENVNIIVSNRGTADACGTVDDPTGLKSYVVDLVLSSDPTAPVTIGTVPDPYVFHEDMLLKGGRLSITKSITTSHMDTYSIDFPPFDVVGEIPPGCPHDTMYVVAVVDPCENVTEVNEGNNVASGSIRVER